MKTVIVRNYHLQPFEVSSDGRTIWVNDDHGCMVGRFSAKGIDVHYSIKDKPEKHDRHCLDCRPGAAPFGKPSWSEFISFAASMFKHHRIKIPEGDTLITNWRDHGE